MSDKKYMTAKELSEHIGKTSKTVRRWIELGQVQAYQAEGRFGLEYRIPIEECQRVIEMHTVKEIDYEDFQTVQDEPEAVKLPLEAWKEEQTKVQVAAHTIGVLEGQIEAKNKELEYLRGRLETMETRQDERDKQLVEVIKKVTEKKRSLVERLLNKINR